MIPTAITTDPKVPEEPSVARSHPGSPRPVLPDENVRASYFVVRHQWITLRKQWTCLAPDRDHGWTHKDFATFVDSHHWVFARTMPKNPHEYTLRKNALHSTFDDAIRYLRDQGVIEYFSGKPYKMLHTGSHKYWTMGAPLSVTLLINRKTLSADTTVVVPVEPPSGSLPFFPFLPSSVEQLPREDCKDSDGRDFDIDDFEFFVTLVREAGLQIHGHCYLELDGYLYWTRGVPEKAQAVHRARRPVGSSA